MKTEVDKLNISSKMRMVKPTPILFKTIKIIAFRKCIINIIFRMNLRLYRQRIHKVLADGYK
jgi:hypothetical protein